ncbi:hypothetical protein QVD17_15073 [Tagetes erecta]|uniref:CRIB domain-containing protein n=1 Tax=Tagetes erecta TaxID=13708 RepID=A0AAD8KU85_TARER|nr:hypothetical protein QVD17_15073 [Tagetes erecta]
MKGLLKGLRYISEIFEADNEKEPEIQIGAPTDVKHVAHIGCDGPSSSAPTWMNDFQGSSNSSGGASESKRTSDRHGKSKQSKKQIANETSHGRRNKNQTTESESQDSGAKKNRRKKRTSTRDSSSTSNANE